VASAFSKVWSMKDASCAGEKICDICIELVKS
jgi:hypothetical protein